MAKRDYYEVLEISKSATKDEIKVLTVNLPKNITLISIKKRVLQTSLKKYKKPMTSSMTIKKKQTYDQFGHAAFDQNGGGGDPFGGQGGFGGGMDFGDIFSSFFGGGGGQRRQSRPTGPIRGNDVLTRFKIDFMDAINGTKIEFSHTFPIKFVQTCNGLGARNASDIHTCSKCRGSGVETFVQDSIFGRVQSQRTCSQCGGSGKTITNKCSTCSGSGYTRVKEKTSC